MYNKKKAKQLTKAVKKSVKDDLKRETFDWCLVDVLMTCDFCPANNYCLHDKECNTVLKEWYEHNG